MTIAMESKFYQKVMAIIRQGIASFGNASALARAAGTSAANLMRRVV